MVDTIVRELRELGIGSRVVRWNGAGGEAVVFPFDVLSGRFRCTTLDVGLSFQEAAYPEYPPHFIHVRGLDAANSTRHSEHKFEGALWWTFSAPPSDFWDALDSSQKNMRTYVRRHLLRFLHQL